jgi:DNA-binding transcriptional regulator YdaS (Cro superfamily)
MNTQQKEIAQKALQEAIAKAGGQTALAKIVKRKQPTVNGWIIAPAHHVLLIEKFTGVSKCRLRPDIYPSE